MTFVGSGKMVARHIAVLIAVPILGGSASGTESAAPIPDFTGTWTHPAFPWFEPPASGPGPITNLSRWAEQRPAGDGGSAALPPSNVGISNNDQLVGDYKSPILQPWAAEVVKRFGQMALDGIGFPTLSDQCWPYPLPFIYRQWTVVLMQQQDKITMAYFGDNSPDVRHVRMNQPHPSPLTSSWYGDSIGYYEDDTLVIDTVGVKANRPYAMLDFFGRNEKENWLFIGDVWSRHRGKFLQLHVTIEDEGAFTTPWTATLTYVPRANQTGEVVCAENPREYYNDKDSDIPKSGSPDF